MRCAIVLDPDWNAGADAGAACNFRVSSRHVALSVNKNCVQIMSLIDIQKSALLRARASAHGRRRLPMIELTFGYWRSDDD